jgi:hypothetical protein
VIEYSKTNSCTSVEQAFRKRFGKNPPPPVRINRRLDNSEIEVNLRPTDSRPVCLGVRHPSGTRDQFFFLLKISFRQLRFCYFVAPSLMRGRACNLLVQLLLSLPRAVTLGSKSCRTHGHILLSHLRLTQPGGPGSSIYIPQEQGSPVIPLALGLDNSDGQICTYRKQSKVLA